MKIVVIVRTRNEQARIGPFCEAYGDADRILVGDGGSTDFTVELARTYKNVEVHSYEGRTQMEGGHWRNNDSDHTNFLIVRAKEHNPDWIISDDCDCRPNFLLREDLRRILERDASDCDVVMAVRLYLWGKDQHFPHMAKILQSHTKWETSLWAWHGDLDLWTVNVPPAFTFRIGQKAIRDFRNDTKVLELFPPPCLLHYSWDDPERVRQKVALYRESGLISGQLHPLDFAGPLEPLPEWAHE